MSGVYPKAPFYEESSVTQLENQPWSITEDEFLDKHLFRLPPGATEPEDSIIFWNGVRRDKDLFVYSGIVNIKAGQLLVQKPLWHGTADGKGGCDYVLFRQDYSITASITQAKECDTIHQGQESKPVALSGNSGTITFSIKDNEILLTPSSTQKALPEFCFNIVLRRVPERLQVTFCIYDGNKKIWCETFNGRTKFVEAYLPQVYTAVLVEKSENVEVAPPQQSELKEKWIASYAATNAKLGQTIVALVDRDRGNRFVLKAYDTDKLSGGAE
jgi:hypothetical protein